MMRDDVILKAAHVPKQTLRPQSFGLWHIARHDLTYFPMTIHRQRVGFDYFTVLHHARDASIHHSGTGWPVVMEDSMPELRKHLPIFRRAQGRVLVSGLGLGCVVCGLLAKPDVTHVDVIELDRHILRVVGKEFENSERVTLHQGDALKIKLPGQWDFAWHDLWTDGQVHLQRLHAKLFVRFARHCGWQGAWHFPGNLARRLPWTEIP